MGSSGLGKDGSCGKDGSWEGWGETCGAKVAGQGAGLATCLQGNLARALRVGTREAASPWSPTPSPQPRHAPPSSGKGRLFHSIFHAGDRQVCYCWVVLLFSPLCSTAKPHSIGKWLFGLQSQAANSSGISRLHSSLLLQFTPIYLLLSPLHINRFHR